MSGDVRIHHRGWNVRGCLLRPVVLAGQLVFCARVPFWMISKIHRWRKAALECANMFAKPLIGSRLRRPNPSLFMKIWKEWFVGVLI